MSARVWSLWTATFENADRIAAHDRNELSALQMLQPAHRFQELPVPGHLARLAASPNRLVPKQLPEVAGERRVEAQLSHKIAESLPVRDRVDPELRRHQPLHGAAELASDRCRCTGKISLSYFPGVKQCHRILRWCISKKRPLTSTRAGRVVECEKNLEPSEQRKRPGATHRRQWPARAARVHTSTPLIAQRSEPRGMCAQQRLFTTLRSALSW